jgi:hypothetical protein
MPLATSICILGVTGDVASGSARRNLPERAKGVHMSDTTHRQARIFIGEKGDHRAVRVSHPGKLTPEEIHRIDHVLINDVIKGLTGCACLSGTIDVIWERQFEKVLDVQLG